MEADECIDADFGDFRVAGSLLPVRRRGPGLIHRGDGFVNQPGSDAGDPEGRLDHGAVELGVQLRPGNRGRTAGHCRRQTGSRACSSRTQFPSTARVAGAVLD